MNYFTKIKKITKDKGIYILLIILIALFLSAPLYTRGFYWSHDGVYHISRNYATNSEIISKQLPPLIEPNFCKGFGYAWNIFYPPLETYISSIFSIFTSLLNAIKLTIMLSIIAAGITMFALMKKITKNHTMSFLTAIIYMSAPYFLSDIYVRMAMGEVIAYIFFPLLFYGLYDIFYDTGKQSYFITIGALGIILSHNISTLMAVIISSIFVLINIKKLFTENSLNLWKKLIINGFFIILISLGFYIPFLEHKFSTEYAIFSQAFSVEKFSELAIYPSQLFFSVPKAEWAYSLSSNMINESMSFELGLPIIIALLFTPIVLPKIKKENKILYITTLCTGIFFAIMATSIFPWKYIPIVPTVIQFPWRFLIVSTLTLSIISGINIYHCMYDMKSNNIYILILIILIYSGTYISNSVKYDVAFDTSYLNNNIELVNNQCAAYEYLPLKANSNLEYIRQRSNGIVITSGIATIENEQKDESNMTFTIKESSENTTLELPYIYYLGYTIKINDSKIDYTESDNGFIQITIQAYDSASVEVTYTGTLIEKISFAISIISSICFIVYIIYNEKIKNINSNKYLQD